MMYGYLVGIETDQPIHSQLIEEAILSWLPEQNIGVIEVECMGEIDCYPEEAKGCE